MTGLDHNRADLAVREMFALTKEKTERTLTAILNSGAAGGLVIISTCNRTELYATVPDDCKLDPTAALCDALCRDCRDYEQYFTERADERAIRHLCRTASGLDSQILGDDQIITQTREALELSRGLGCTDGYIETMFNTAIQAAKSIKTNVLLRTLGLDSVPSGAVAKLKTVCSLAGKKAVVIGNGQMGRLVSELLIREGADVTVTLREYKKGVIQVPKHADTIGYSERYKAVGMADIVISATASPHYTLYYEQLSVLSKLPEYFIDLAVPRDIEPSVGQIPGVTLMTIDDISGEGRVLPIESLFRIEAIISEHVEKYYRWLMYKEKTLAEAAGGGA